MDGPEHFEAFAKLFTVRRKHVGVETAREIVEFIVRAWVFKDVSAVDRSHRLLTNVLFRYGRRHGGYEADKIDLRVVDDIRRIVAAVVEWWEGTETREHRKCLWLASEELHG